MNKIREIVERNLTVFLVTTPIINVLSIWILVTIHWTTGKFGYVFSSFFVFLGLTITFLIIILNRRLKFNGRTLLNILLSLLLSYIVYTDIKLMTEAINNNGLIPCHLGPSCP